MEPRFCPHCGRQGTLQQAELPLAIAERGCYDGTTYCYVGPLPTLKCESCGFTFSTDVSEDVVHASCRCGDNALCTCGRYRRAKVLRGFGDPPSED